MNVSQSFTCQTPHRVALLQNLTDGSLNGIDYLEVLPHVDPLKAPDTLEVHFVHPITLVGDLARQVRIDGGVRFPAPAVVSATAVGNVMTVVVSGDTDASTYTLRLVKSPLVDDPPTGIDAILSAVPFSFRVLCPTDFDCRPEPDCEAESPDAPHIDYLTKDYNSFRRLMLDRVTALVPGGIETNAADLTVSLVEVLAYAADQLSYYQDAVSTESYLGTARLRTSARRHARLVDYPTDDGQNARVWVFVEASGTGLKIPKGTQLVAKHNAATLLDEAGLASAVRSGNVVFETMEDLSLDAGRNEIQIHTWGDRDCCIEAGATTAALINTMGALNGLARGEVILFEQTCDPSSGIEADADPNLRHCVRLSADPVFTIDPLVGHPSVGGPARIAIIEWGAEDAMPFSLLLSSPEGPAAVARGNVLLADHGYTLEEDLTDIESDGRFRLSAGPVARQARASSRGGPVVRGEDNQPALFDPEGSAAAAIKPYGNLTLPSIALNDKMGQTWLPQRDLLRSGRFGREFVVETETDGSEHLRFGDGVSGAELAYDPENPPLVRYRVGTGSAGNIGSGGIAHMVGPYASVVSVRNPLPASGGRDPELMESIRRFAPVAFKVSQRAVTLEDYESVSVRHPEVQRAKAERVWTGSWYATRVLVDRKGGRPVDAEFERDVRAFLETYRMASVDLEIRPPIFVPLDIYLKVCLHGDTFRHQVRAGLQKAFSTRTGGFFDPDLWTFGQSVGLSALIERAMSVDGVRWVDLGPTSVPPVRFQKMRQPSSEGLTTGVIEIDVMQIARLDNDPNFPENGRIGFELEGGL